MIREGLRVELDHQQRRAEPEMAYARNRVTELEQERRRLARGVVTGSIPEDLGREEQGRISRELDQAKRTLTASPLVFAKIAETLNRALELVGRCDEVYRLGGPQVRRLSNQFFFEQLLLDVEEDEGAVVTGAVLREPWATLLTRDFQAQMAANTTNVGRHVGGRRSKMIALAPPAGLEPATKRLEVSRSVR
jgi:site-specific DNA recombinase